ncbi:hypothetical protein K439DRAFT_1616537 [Ramaria rubella]|nr:hypothetical protein K439DRAFT_1616537 [Ramaria rubella]
MAHSPGTIVEQQVRLEASLRTLKMKVLGLPKTLPSGTAEGPIPSNFGDFMAHSTDSELQALVLGGQYGLQMVYTYLSYFSKVPQMEEHNGLNLLYLRCTQLLELIEKVTINSPQATNTFYASSGGKSALANPANTSTLKAGTQLGRSVAVKAMKQKQLKLAFQPIPKGDKKYASKSSDQEEDAEFVPEMVSSDTTTDGDNEEAQESLDVNKEQSTEKSVKKTCRSDQREAHKENWCAKEEESIWNRESQATQEESQSNKCMHL